MSSEIQKIVNTALVTTQMEERKERIIAYHQGCLRAFGHQMGYAFLCGLELLQAKEDIEHGKFLKWREENLPDLPERTAQQYMRFTEGVRSKSATVADLTKQPLQLTNGQLPEKQREEVLKAVHEAADGKTLTEFYRELGLIRQPKPKEYHPPKMTAKEKADADLKLAEDGWADVMGSVRIWICQGDTIGKVSDKTKREMLECLIEANKRLRAAIKEKRTAKATKPRKQQQ